MHAVKLAAKQPKGVPQETTLSTYPKTGIQNAKKNKSIFLQQFNFDVASP
ncbi:hypothetical protein QG37_00785 [Candidozyma auris]|uniref:Uncharacterized protein n=1 Tax=Candidozyma auris TaxID=498019 RepID=A0A0L0P714_CANAR|nr:hypothetical protein QG37_00785 [[Candida] auris]